MSISETDLNKPCPMCGRQMKWHDYGDHASTCQAALERGEP
jgi:endogenous inhibitor of DNA gyrase (YacG/DUF329 family)